MQGPRGEGDRVLVEDSTRAEAEGGAYDRVPRADEQKVNSGV